MRRWLFALGGLLAWTVHFLGVYLIASLEHRFSGAVNYTAAAGLFSLICLGVCVAITTVAAGRLRSGVPDASIRLLDQVAAWGGTLGAIAILWQSASVLSPF